MNLSRSKSGFALFIGLLVFTASCSKKSDEVTPTETTCTPTEYTHSLDGKGKISLKLLSTAGQVTSFELSDVFIKWKAAIRYENGLPVAMDHLDDTGKVKEKDGITFQYDSQKRLTQFTVYYSADQQTILKQLTLSYNASGQVSKLIDKSLNKHSGGL